MRVLYLSAWYPSEKDQMVGLFVKKHAQAVRAQGVDVKVLDYEVIPKGWRPDVIQLNVLSLKNALKTYWLHKRYGVPYIIVEHWSRYLPQNCSFPKGIEAAVLRFVAKRASMILPVSENLRQAMQNCGIENAHWQVVRNVVDDFFYEPFTPTKHDKVELLHVSCFDEKAKNVKGLLRAMEQLYKHRQDWHLTLVGTGVDYAAVRAYADTLQLPATQLTWTGELTPEQVCGQMQQSDVLVLASRYETYGMPLAEAMAVGIPSIETDTCGLRLDASCGISISADNLQALEQAVAYMLDHHLEYNVKEIRNAGKCFSAKVIGQSLMAMYQSVV